MAYVDDEHSSVYQKKTKLRLYTSLIKPILVYDLEAWTLGKTETKLLECFERKMLRTILRRMYICLSYTCYITNLQLAKQSNSTGNDG